MRTWPIRQAGYLADLSLLPTIGTFKGIARDQMFSGGSLTYVPTSISAFGLYCNLDLLAERGVAVPQTYPELLDACAAFADADVAPIVCNNDISLKTFAIARALGPLYRSGTAANAIEGFNERPEELARALAPGFEAVKELVTRGFVDAATALETKKTSDDLEQFAAGKAPFMLTGAWPRCACTSWRRPSPTKCIPIRAFGRTAMRSSSTWTRA